ncbi:NAD-dependent epimerase/dehydratase family protein [Solirubrobacter taibaiensis]|nr:NAD-dependent epimerase/dehydratase family protein [Solirubrobacter taibaiensis]
MGSSLVRRLVTDGEQVAILRLAHDDARALGQLSREVEHRVGDVRAPDTLTGALRGVDCVYHLAGVATAVNAHSRHMCAVNVDGTGHLMRAALQSQVRRVVHTSSAIAIGIPDAATPVDESFAFNGGDFDHAYATTKRHGEEIVRGAVAEGLDVVILNPSAVMAPGGSLRHGWAGLVAAVHRGLLRAYPDGGVSMTPETDVADAHVRAMQLGRTGERYIVASHHLSYADLTRAIAEVVGVTPPRVRLPDAAVAVAGLLGSAVARVRSPEKSPFLTRENAVLMTRTMFYDQAKAVRELGVRATPLEPAIAAVDAWCRRAGAV